MPQKNHGVILGRRPTDYIAGVLSPLVWENRNPSGDWTPYLPPGEWQRLLVFPYTDFMDCVTESLQNVIETQEKFLTGEQEDLSGRWSAKENGTTEQGNWLSVVADHGRLHGFVLEKNYPDISAGTWADQYAPIPEPLATQLSEEGKRWLERWQIQYEFVEISKKSFLHELQHAPLQIVIPGHAIMSFYCPADVVKYFDTYEPFIKETTYSKLQDALKIVLTQKAMPKFFRVDDHGKLGIMILEGYTGIILFEDKMTDYITLTQITNDQLATAPIIKIP